MMGVGMGPEGGDFYPPPVLVCFQDDLKVLRVLMGAETLYTVNCVAGPISKVAYVIHK